MDSKAIRLYACDMLFMYHDTANICMYVLLYTEIKKYHANTPKFEAMSVSYMCVL